VDLGDGLRRRLGAAVAPTFTMTGDQSSLSTIANHPDLNPQSIEPEAENAS
jgi:hypothetical protein